MSAAEADPSSALVPSYPDLAGKVAVVTGGSKGIGAATCVLLGRNGARVAVHGRDETAIEEVAARTHEAGAAEAVGVAADATTPEGVARLREEVEAGEDDYMRAVLTESLRLRPVVPIAGRRLAEEVEVEGWKLPAGTDVTPAIYLTHTRPDLYPEPLAFRPERFLDSGPETYGWIPFGGGVRRCLGAAFAEFEMRIVLRAVVERCELVSARARPEQVARRNITFSPRHGTPVSLVRREPAPSG